MCEGDTVANHEFGIMEEAPQKGVRYDSYEPQKYNCFAIDDTIIASIANQFLDITMYWHTLDRLEKGLAYSGITLIPPSSINAIIDVIIDEKELSIFKELLLSAKQQNKFVIHYGV